uniref:Uncharacterized protein n=1 Tax=Kalanchoe fedtschenkoi TaxID=63787 RepID=A0A7N0U2F8_KALFE
MRRPRGGDSLHRQPFQGGWATPRTYASVVTETRVSHPFFPDVPLKGRQVQKKKGAPLIVFGNHELDMAFRMMAFTLVIKFSSARPRVGEISERIECTWRLETRPYVGALDEKHALVICGLDEGLMSNFLREIGRGFGRFMKVDEQTLSPANPAIARVCVEVDMARPLVQGLWVGSETHPKWVEVDYEGCLDYCGRRRRHGNTRADCHKSQNNHKHHPDSYSQPGMNSGESLSVAHVVNDQKEGRWTVV